MCLVQLRHVHCLAWTDLAAHILRIRLAGTDEAMREFLGKYNDMDAQAIEWDLMVSLEFDDSHRIRRNMVFLSGLPSASTRSPNACRVDICACRRWRKRTPKLSSKRQCWITGRRSTTTISLASLGVQTHRVSPAHRSGCCCVLDSRLHDTHTHAISRRTQTVYIGL